MASVAVEGAAKDEGKKKAGRLNPARRKAAKLKTDQKGTDSISADGTVAPQQQLSKTPSNSKSLGTGQPAPTPSPAKDSASPTTLIRQSTQPTTTSTPNPKPNLPRSKTAPPPPRPTPTRKQRPPSSALSAPAALITGGLVGCAASTFILLSAGLWNEVTTPETAILTTKAAKLCVDNFAEELLTSLRAGTYSTDEALDILRRTTLAYAAALPGGAGWVEKVFLEIGMLRKQRGREVEGVVREVLAEVRQGKGLREKESMVVVRKVVARLGALAGEATGDVVARNPGLRDLGEGSARALRGGGEGGEAKVPTVRVNMVVRQMGLKGKI